MNRGNGAALTLIACLVLLCCAILLAVRFGWIGQNTPEVRLPEETAKPSSIPDSGTEPTPTDGLDDREYILTVRPDTVQAVLASMKRPEGYSRTLKEERFWEGGSSLTQVSVWQKNGMTRIRLESEDGTVKNLLVRDGTVRIWYDGTPGSRTVENADSTLSDLLQGLPTYEDILALNPEKITAASFQSEGEIGFISVTVTEGGYTTVYEISTDSGLLERAERYEGETLIYRMCAEEAELAAPADSWFMTGD